ncbi:MAG TPA: NifB/NifX family molybdenum-iron cluster-binding protein, partial [Synergistaceae bacterium]|nr:NifB/NifX family molybdenum-iron cluster-binding protein [Synergistaceae bacterium]
MRIAIPCVNGKLCMHFGHCEEFALVEVDADSKSVKQVEATTPPPHEPGVLPRWLAEKNVDVIIAGGMGSRAQDLFAQNGISVIVGASCGTPEELAKAYLEGTLQT